jgi:MFS family permease
MLPFAVGTASTMAVGGRLADRIGSRIPVVIGTVVLAASYIPLANLTPNTSLTLIGATLFVGGLGAGLAMMPPNIVAMNSVRAAKVSQATALNQVTRQLSAAIGTAALASLLAGLLPTGDANDPSFVADSVDAFNVVFDVTIGLLVVATLLACALPGKRKALELQAERRAEQNALRAIGELDVQTEGGLITEVV